MEPTSASTYDRARRLANLSLRAISLQCRRLHTKEPEDNIFALRRLTDFDFLIVALTRLRRAAIIITKLPETQKVIRDAVKQFDLALPNLKKLRDVAEHIDDYAVDSGKDRTVSRKELETTLFTDNGLTWLGHHITIDEALGASQTLFDSIKSVSVVFTERS